MKKLIYLISLSLLISAVALSGCGDDDSDGLSLAEQQTAALLGTWTVVNGADVTLNDQTPPGDWAGFSLTFDNNGAASNSNPPTEADIFTISTFEVSGTGDVNNFSITFNNVSTETATVAISGNSMIFSFNLASETDVLGARKQGVDGDWAFNFTK